jgi:predicted transcriptional regulator
MGGIMEYISKKEKIKELIKNGKINKVLQFVEEDTSLLEEIYGYLESDDIQVKINCLTILGNLYLRGKFQITILLKRLENVLLEEDKNTILNALLILKEIPEVYQEDILKRIILKYIGKYVKDCECDEKSKSTLPNIKRDKIMIIFEILKAIKDKELKKTKIMYAANLDWKTFSNYIGYLLDNEFIKKTDGAYTLTPKGELLLEKIEEVFRLIYPDK